MKIEVTKHTDLAAARRALATTMDKSFVSTATFDQLYTWMHSPVRTQLFEVFLEDVPTFVSVHLVRHVTIVPFVTSKRDDRGGDKTEDRYTPVDMRFWCNAEALLNMAAKRLCYKASPETQDVMLRIQAETRKLDPALANHMVPACARQGGYCREPFPCGNYKVKRYNPVEIMEGIRL